MTVQEEEKDVKHRKSVSKSRNLQEPAKDNLPYRPERKPIEIE